MTRKQLFLKTLSSFALKPSFKLPWNPPSYDTNFKPQKYTPIVHKTGLSNQTLIFHLENVLLKSSSMFPYFMLVAFEAGGILRALVLFLLYPLICLVGKQLGLKIMVFVSFVGIKKDKFRMGTAVLPKFFLEDIGLEGFNVVMKFGRKIAVSDLPRVMVEGLLKDYLDIEDAVARELKVFNGYFVGLMEDKNAGDAVLKELFGDTKIDPGIIGLACFSKCIGQQLLRHCKEVYWVSNSEKKNWQVLPRKKYPKPLIFHDGRLAFRPTPLATLAMLMWFPLGIFVFITRFMVLRFFPFEIAGPVAAFTGMQATISKPKLFVKKTGKSQGILYICNHRTLLDVLYISYALNQPAISTVTYSLSKYNEIIAPIKTFSLTRNREKDEKLMEILLSKGDLVVCPEGTTCREPYLLRFSPLFAEISGDIVPVAVNVKADMFYGSTASGLKVLDPMFHLLNPYPIYYVKFLDKLPSSLTCEAGGKSRIEVANHVQNEISKALGFECTNFTRKDKYMTLAGNNGTV